MLKRPIMHVLTFVAGLVVVCVIAPLRHNEMYIVRGGELVVLALAQSLLNGQLRLFLRLLILSGVFLPIAAMATMPIFYRGSSLGPFLEGAAFTALPGAVLILLGWWELRRIKTRTPAPPASRRVWWIEFCFRAALLIIVSSFATGEWSDFTVSLVILGALLLLGGMMCLLPLYLRITAAGIGLVLLLISATTIGLCVLLLALSGGHVSGEEAATGIIPALAVGIVGLLLILQGSKVGGTAEQSTPIAGADTVIYLDNNATTCVAPEVLEAMLPYLRSKYANPSSMHFLGREAAQAISRAREQLAALLGCRATELVFTSSGTEANNMAIQGVIQAFPEKRHIIISKVEHPAVRNPCKHLARHGYRLTELAVDQQGHLDLEELRAALTTDTALVSLMYANNETGVLFPITDIADIVKAQGVLLHVDAVQAVGKIPLKLADSGIDLLSVSAHKFHGPKGAGALFMRRGLRLEPLLRGGHQEGGRRSGTESVHNIVGLGGAAELAAQHLASDMPRLQALRDRLENELISLIPDTRINGDRQLRLPHTTNLAFKNVAAEGLLLALSDLGICVATGSACTTNTATPSHVLQAMRVPRAYLQGALRFSFSRYNHAGQVDFILQHLPPLVERLRALH